MNFSGKMRESETSTPISGGKTDEWVKLWNTHTWGMKETPIEKLAFYHWSTVLPPMADASSFSSFFGKAAGS
jgi:hypothetical protein